MKANRGLTVARMVELGGVIRASFYRFDEPDATKVDRDMDLRDAIQLIALKMGLSGFICRRHDLGFRLQPVVQV